MPRKANFTDREIELMVGYITEKHDVVTSSFNNTLTNSTKQNIWKDIAEKCNAMNGHGMREAIDVKKKWRDIKQNSKRKEVARRNEIKQTGNLNIPLTHLTANEQKVVSILGETAISGIDCGTDTDDRAFDVPVPMEATVADPVLNEDPEQEVAGTSAETPAADKDIHVACKKGLKRSYSDALIAIQQDKVEISRKKLKLKEEKLKLYKENSERLVELEEEKLAVAKNILNLLISRQAENISPLLSPIIKFR